MAGEEDCDRDWMELPPDVMAKILKRVGIYDILQNAQKVCTTWRKICKDPAMWRVIKMDKMLDYKIIKSDRSRRLIRPLMRQMCKHVVKRSQGQLVDITLVDFANEELLEYIADRSSQLRRLELAYFHSESHKEWGECLVKFPLLEELSLYRTYVTAEIIEIAGSCCPKLTTLKVNDQRGGYLSVAISIGKSLPELRHLELIGDDMPNKGLQAILDGCRHLELLDLRRCYFLNLKGEFWKKCLEKIKCVKLPNESLEGYPYSI